MDNFENQSHSSYQTIPPTTVMMAGSIIKEESPMRMDEDVSNSNANSCIVSVPGTNATKHPIDMGETMGAELWSVLYNRNRKTQQKQLMIVGPSYLKAFHRARNARVNK